MPKKTKATYAPNGAMLGFEAKLWQAADKMRNNQKMARLTATLAQQFAESARLEAVIQANLKDLGYGH